MHKIAMYLAIISWKSPMVIGALILASSGAALSSLVRFDGGAVGDRPQVCETECCLSDKWRGRLLELTEPFEDERSPYRCSDEEDRLVL